MTVYYQIRKFIKLLTSTIRAAKCCIVLTSPVISPCTMITGLYGRFCSDVLLHSSDLLIVIGASRCVATSPLGHYYFGKYTSYWTNNTYNIIKIIYSMTDCQLLYSRKKHTKQKCRMVLTTDCWYADKIRSQLETKKWHKAQEQSQQSRNVWQ